MRLKLLLLLLLSTTLFANENYIIEDMNIPTLNRHRIKEITLDPFGNIYFISQYGLYEINNNRLLDHNNLIDITQRNEKFKDIQYVDSNLLLLESEDENTYLIDLINKRFIDQRNIPEQNRISKKAQNKNNDYIVSYWGLKRIRNKDENSQLIKSTKNLDIKCTIEFKGKIYVGSTDGFYCISNGLEEIGNIENVNTLYIFNDNLYIGAKEGLFSYSDKITQIVSDVEVFAIYNWNDSLIFGTLRKGLYSLQNNFYKRYDIDVKHITDITSINNTLYVGSFSDGLFYLEDNKWSKVFFSTKMIISLLNKDDKLWIGTLNEGLYTFENYKLSKKLQLKYITDLLDYGDNEIIIAGIESYGVYNTKTDSFTRDLRLVDYSLTNNYNSSFLTEDKILYTGQTSGLFKYKNIQDPSPIPKFLIKNLTLYNSDNLKRVEPGSMKSINIKWPYTGFSLDFKLNSDRNNIRYSYRLYNETLNMSERSGDVSAFNLSPGKYYMEIKAQTTHKELLETSKIIPITINPPIWLTLTFWLFLSILSLILILIIYKLKVKKVEKTNIELKEIVDDISESIINDAQKKEREKLARDLHDSVSQTLFSASITAEILPDLFKRDSKKALEKVNDLRDLTKEAQVEMRSLLYELHPEIFNSTPLETILNKLVNSYLNREVEVNLVIDLEPELNIKSIIYRITQESLNNIKKHSKATRVIIDLKVTNQRKKLLITDNGIGFNIDKIGMGIKIMRERSESIGGELNIDSNKNGTSVSLVWS